MHVFSRLSEIRSFEKRHFPYLVTLVDFDIVRTVGLYQEQAVPLMLRQIFLEKIGSHATLSRGLAKLRLLGVVEATRAPTDRRGMALTLAPPVWLAYIQYGIFLDRPFP